jgi:hypothetical protein
MPMGLKGRKLVWITSTALPFLPPGSGAFSKYMKDPEFLGQEEFRQILHFEEKRAQRSGANFILVILALRGRRGSGSTGVVSARAIELFSAAIRGTDIPGWYEEGRAVGIIFTELAANDPQSVGETLVTAIDGRLKASLSGAELDGLELSYSVRPATAGGSPDEFTTAQNFSA